MRRNIISLLIVISMTSSTLHAQRNSKLDSIGYFLKTIKNDTAGAWKMAELALAMRERNVDSSLILADRTIELSRKLNFDKGLADGLITKGLVYIYKHKPDDAKPFFTEALPLCEKINDAVELSRVYAAFGAYASGKNDLKSHEQFMLKALDYALLTSEKLFTGHVYNALGTVYNAEGKYNLSAKNYMQAISYFEDLHDTIPLSMAYNNLAIVFKNLENYIDAVKYFNLAIEIARASGNKKRIANRLANLGSVYISHGEFEKAKNVLNESLSFCDNPSMISVQVNALRYLGQLYMKQNQNDSAIFFSKASYQLAVNDSDKEMQVAVGKDIAEEYSIAGKKNEALAIANKSLNMAEELHLVPDQIDCIKFLEKYYAGTNDYSKAYYFLARYNVLKDSVFNLQKVNQVEELKTQYETEKKDQQIVLLNKDKLLQQSEIKRQNTIKNFSLAGSGALIVFAAVSFVLYKRKRDADIKQKEALFSSKVSGVEMKALLAQMNPHFIFNSLRSINEYIQHNKSSLASEYLIKFSKLMRAILENSRKKEIVLSKEIEVLELYMQLESQRMEHPFNYSIEIDPGIDKDNSLIPPMLLQPIIENSIWHGLAPQDHPGKIIIRIKKQGEMIQCEVEDDGIGRELSRSINKKDVAKAESYGLKIIEERLAIIEQVKKIKTSLTYLDLNSNNNFAGLKVAFALPYETAI